MQFRYHNSVKFPLQRLLRESSMLTVHLNPTQTLNPSFSYLVLNNYPVRLNFISNLVRLFQLYLWLWQACNLTNYTLSLLIQMMTWKTNAKILVLFSTQLNALLPEVTSVNTKPIRWETLIIALETNLWSSLVHLWIPYRENLAPSTKLNPNLKMMSSGMIKLYSNAL